MESVLNNRSKEKYVTMCVCMLFQNTCTLSFRPDAPSTYTPGGWYAVAITVEDTPTSPITVGGQTYNPGDALTSVPVQVIMTTACFVSTGHVVTWWWW